MDNVNLLILVWIIGWIICSIMYVLSNFKKAKYLNENWSFLNSVKFTPILLIIWPFTLIVYIWSNIRLKMSDSVELPEGLEIVELSKESSQKE
jgi:hypothetical protein